MLRPPPKSGKELDGEQVEESLDDAAEAELGLAKSPRPVLNDQFADPESHEQAASTGMKRCNSPYRRISRNISAR